MTSVLELWNLLNVPVSKGLLKQEAELLGSRASIELCVSAIHLFAEDTAAAALARQQMSDGTLRWDKYGNIVIKPIP